MERIEPDDFTTEYFVIFYIVGSDNYMPGPESSFSCQLGTQPTLDYSETNYSVCGILLPVLLQYTGSGDRGQIYCFAVYHGVAPAKWLQSSPTLCDPVDCSPPGSSVPGILQARIPEWVAMPSSRGSSRPMDRTCIS